MPLTDLKYVFAVGFSGAHNHPAHILLELC